MSSVISVAVNLRLVCRVGRMLKALYRTGPEGVSIVGTEEGDTAGTRSDSMLFK